MAEKQMTFGPVVEMETAVPVRDHPNDPVECSNGEVLIRRDAFEDCRGEYHYTDEDRREANVTIVAEVMDALAKWAGEYCTDNEDFPNGFAYCVSEMKHDWDHLVEEWIDTSGPDFEDCIRELLSEGELECPESMTPDEYVERALCIIEADAIINEVCDDLDDWEPEFDRSDWGCYDGDGCCLWSYQLDEQEEQVDISCHPELQALHESGELDDCLDEYNGDAYISRSRRRVKNEETGRYEPVGRETYNTHPDRNDFSPTFEFYHSPGGQWHFVVCRESMDQHVKDGLQRLCEREVEG